MSVQSEINRLATAKTAIGTAIAGKGVAVPSGTKLDGMAALIDGIEAGGEDVSAETAEYTSLLTDLETAIDSLPDAGSGGGSGGSGGTCSVEIMAYGPVQAGGVIQYINELGAISSKGYTTSEIMMGFTLSVQVNSPISSGGSLSSPRDPVGDIVRLNAYCYYVRGSGTIYVGG